MQDAAFLSSRRFGGIARLYGDEALARFSRAHVCVVGVGGVGSWAVEALARSGIGRLTLIDLDNVAESNINRQLHALTDDFGKAKVTALRERIAQINPQCEVTEIEDFVTEDNLDELFRRPFDFVIDAIDQIRVKAAMAAYFVQHKQPFIISGGAGGQKNPALIQTADLSRVTHDPLLSNLRYTLRKRYGFSRDTKEKNARALRLFNREYYAAAIRRSVFDRCRAARFVLRGLRREYAGDGFVWAVLCAGCGGAYRGAEVRGRGRWLRADFLKPTLSVA